MYLFLLNYLSRAKEVYSPISLSQPTKKSLFYVLFVLALFYLKEELKQNIKFRAIFVFVQLSP